VDEQVMLNALRASSPVAWGGRPTFLSYEAERVSFDRWRSASGSGC
jgi:hypothetical protein